MVRQTQMKVAVDTNILVHAVVGDDPPQAAAAARLLRDAQTVAVAVPVLCEFVWVLRRLYGFQPTDAGNAIRTLLTARNVVTNRPAVESGLTLLDAGGDFADGVIAHEGRRLGGETFVSFDTKAVQLLRAQGNSARMP